MNYDCEFIQDVVSLYKDDVLRDKSRELVNGHLAECKECKDYYDMFSSDTVETVHETEDVQVINGIARKIKEYHLYQIGLFMISVITMFTMVFPWFGYRGITEINGAVMLGRPAAIIGFALVEAAIWFNFKSCKKRMICGYTGLGLIILTEIYLFLTVFTGSTVGLDFYIFSFDLPRFMEINISDSFSYARFGFYAGFISTLCETVAFSLFVHKIK